MQFVLAENLVSLPESKVKIGMLFYFIVAAPQGPVRLQTDQLSGPYSGGKFPCRAGMNGLASVVGIGFGGRVWTAGSVSGLFVGGGGGGGGAGFEELDFISDTLDDCFGRPRTYTTTPTVASGIEFRGIAAKVVVFGSGHADLVVEVTDVLDVDDVLEVDDVMELDDVTLMLVCLGEV